MALIEVPRDPSSRALAWFGILLGAMLALIGLILLWRFDAVKTSRVLLGLGVLLPAVYYAVPALRRPIYLGWVYLAWPIGTAISFLLLAVVWYVVVTPIGLLRRTLGEDPMQRKLDPAAPSYWTPHAGRPDPERYFRTY